MLKLNFQGVFQGPGKKFQFPGISRNSRSSGDPVSYAVHGRSTNYLYVC